jgi:hypothetical protein
MARCTHSLAPGSRSADNPHGAAKHVDIKDEDGSKSVITIKLKQ